MKRIIKTYYCLLLVKCIAVQDVSSQAGHISLSAEPKNLYDISRLPQLRSHTFVGEVSSYDTTGGNNDGFSGNYSFVRRNADSSLVMLDIKGPGVVNRIWTPTPTGDTLDFYIDSDLRPALSICYLDLFSGKIYPFVAPLCNHAVGGYFCYLPIPFQSRCKIVCRGKHLQFHQIQYRLYPQGTKVERFHAALSNQEKDLLAKTAERWSRCGVFPYNKKFSQSTVSFDLKPGETKEIFHSTKGGRIAGIELIPSSFLDSNFYISINWDDEKSTAVFCPAADFFGYAFGKPSMKSLLLGTDSLKHYCYFPMPFDKRAKIELVYKSALANESNLSGSITVHYNNQKRDARREGKFYASYVKNNLTENDPYHILLDIKGRGHYVGTILQAQGFIPRGTDFFEGDDSTAIDGAFRIHGTGSEDYFNGGWYNIKGRWDTTRSLPLSGCLTYSLELGRTGGYRFYLSDKLSFEKSIYQCIEHGATKRGVPVVYTSIAFYYLKPNY